MQDFYVCNHNHPNRIYMNRIYMNTDGLSEKSASWSSYEREKTVHIALGDAGNDGDSPAALNR